MLFAVCIEINAFPSRQPWLFHIIVSCRKLCKHVQIWFLITCAQELEIVRDEVAIMKKLRHPTCISLHDFIDTKVPWHCLLSPIISSLFLLCLFSSLVSSLCALYFALGHHCRLLLLNARRPQPMQMRFVHHCRSVFKSKLALIAHCGAS